MRLLRSFLALLLLAVAFAASAQKADFDKLEQQLRLKPHQKEQFAQARSALLEDDQVAIAKRYVEERLKSLPGLIP